MSLTNKFDPHHDPEDDRGRFEEQALHAFYASGLDLMGIGWTVDNLTAFVLQVFPKPDPAPLEPLAGDDPIPF